MALAIRHRSDALPALAEIPGLEVRREIDAIVMAELQVRSIDEIQSRFDAGHRAFVARLDGQPAAWGWVATQSAKLGELGLTFTFSKSERYLWNFVTRPDFRGRGIYPRLIEAIIAAESAEAERFWIAYAPENHASGVGIRKAGFTTVAELSFDQLGKPVVKGVVEGGGVAASQLLSLPHTEQAVAQCWKCVRNAKLEKSACSAGQCSCDYQRPEQSCAS